MSLYIMRFIKKPMKRTITIQYWNIIKIFKRFHVTVVMDTIYRNANASKMIQYLFFISTDELTKIRKWDFIRYANFFFSFFSPDSFIFIFLHLNIYDYTFFETTSFIRVCIKLGSTCFYLFFYFYSDECLL